ncbi:MAG: glycosyltransferase family 2 protein [Gammaproteobacteria bacterium]|nr:glycosyltransferase family 2 protein [Gammaproteobacteria bacterium]
MENSLLEKILIIDNASSDDSVACIKKLEEPRIEIIENDVNLGFARANNIGLTRYDSRFYLLINPDCVVSDNAVATVVRALEENTSAGMAGPLIVNSDGTEQRGCRRRLPNPGNSILRAFGIHRLFSEETTVNFDLQGTPLPEDVTQVEAISGAFMLIKREALLQVGLMDEGYFLHCEDLDWCRRFADLGWQVIFVPAAKTTHFQGTSSASVPIFVLWHKHKGMWRFYRKFYAKPHNFIFSFIIWAGIWVRFAAMTAFTLVTHRK